MENILYYDIELRDKDGNLYRTTTGRKLTMGSFKFTDSNDNESIVFLICKNTAENYEAVCKEGTEVNIDVRTYNGITKTYPIAYSYYGKEKRFVKH